MRKVVIHRPGGYDRLKIEEHPEPQPGPGEVRVRTEAAGVNYADAVVRMGLYASARKYVGWPITPGFEIAGTVDKVGSDVDDLEPGAEVYGVCRFGGYASSVVLPRAQLFARPRTLADAANAAAFPTVFLTAYYALFELAAPRDPSRLRRAGAPTLLVHSAAGGVGGALLQLATIAGCRSIAVVGAAHKVAAARELGADEVIDKSREALWPTVARYAPGGCDVVFDANGATTLRDSYRHLAPAGRLVIYGFHSMLPKKGGRPSWPKLAFDYLRMPRFNPLQMTGDNKSVMAFNLSYLFDHVDLLAEAMRQLTRWLDDARLKPPPVRRYRLEQVARAHRDIESGSTVGKLVLVP